MHYNNCSVGELQFSSLSSLDAANCASRSLNPSSEAESLLPQMEIIEPNPASGSTEQLKVEIFEYIGHELRSPLAAIISTLHLLAEGVLGEIDETARASVLKASRSSKRLLNLVNEMLDVQRKSHDELVKFVETDVEEVLEVAAAEVAALAAEKSQSIVIESSANEATMDPDRIGQVVINLLSNAIKVSPVGAVIRLSARVVNDSVEVEVIDQGTGIPSTIASRLFTKYSQAKAAPGTSGLGLVISKGIVRSHGGFIGAENLPGGNARFWFSIPATQGRKSAAS